MMALPVTDDAPLIDLSAPDSPPPVEATTATRGENPAEPGQGARFGDERVDSRVVEEYEAEPVQVYPDDPESAWWEVNVRHAFARAQREMKPMLLLFTAAWRPEAMALSEEVFATKSFNNYVKENLVICFLSYPPPGGAEPPKSMEWAKKEFKVAGYPSVLIFNPNGEVVRSLRGYRKGRPVDYFNDLKAACAPALESIKQQKESLSRQGFREWRNGEGKGIFARFVKRDDLLMTLRDGRGQEWTIAIDQLREEDRKMARSFPRIDQVRR